MKYISFIGIFLLGIVFGWATKTWYEKRQPAQREIATDNAQPINISGDLITQPELNLRHEMRHLWVEHIMWTRLCMLSALADAKDFDLLIARLLKNKQEIGALFATYYGKEVGTHLTQLLSEHVSIALDLVKAAKENKKWAAWGYDSKLTKNAHEIANYLAKINPEWSARTLKAILDEHLALTKEAAVARWQDQCDVDIQALDKIHAQILNVADELSAGIIKQFPQKFRETVA